MSGGLGTLKSLPTARDGPENMRVDVCLHRNAAAVAAADEEAWPSPARGRGTAMRSRMNLRTLTQSRFSLVPFQAGRAQFSPQGLRPSRSSAGRRQ